MLTLSDAVDIIIRYSPDYQTILNRKTVKRDVLFQYLHDNNVSLTPPMTKLALIQKILEYWGTTRNDNQDCSAQSENANGSALSETTNMQNTEDEVKQMATKFAEWFYTMMNEDQCMGEEHFWQDCSLKLNLMSSSATVENQVDNNRSDVVKLLYETKRDHCLFFNPNLTKDGVFGKMDVHGLVMVFVCGTLHTSECCVGIFEQIFALARDPFADNNWKIKNTRLNLESNDAVNETPKLSDNLFSREVVPSSESLTTLPY